MQNISTVVIHGIFFHRPISFSKDLALVSPTVYCYVSIAYINGFSPHNHSIFYPFCIYCVYGQVRIFTTFMLYYCTNTTIHGYTISLDDFKNLWQIFEKVFFSMNNYDVVSRLLDDVNAYGDGNLHIISINYH